jgi:hypothetical protein
MAFIECLPRTESDRATRLVVWERMNFEELVDKYRNNCISLLPRFTLERTWRECTPHDRKWNTIDLWFSKWQALARNVGEIPEEQKRQQFDAALLKVQPRIIRELHEEEINRNSSIPLLERWEFVSKKLRMAVVLEQMKQGYEAEHGSASPSSVSSMYGNRSDSSQRQIVCHFCKKTGHIKRDCRELKNRMSRSPRKFKGSRKGSSRSNSSNSGRSITSPRQYTPRGRSPWRKEQHRNSPYNRRTHSSQSGSSNYSRSSGKGRQKPKGHKGKGRKGQEKGYKQNEYVDRRTLLERQRNGSCLTCGSKNHRANSCPRKKTGRGPSRFGRGSTTSHNKPRVGFKVSEVQDETLTSDREGDVEEEEEEEDYSGDEQIVDSYMAVHSLRNWEMEEENPYYWDENEE